MTIRSLAPILLSCAAGAALAAGLAAQTPNQQTLTLSQPTQPATVNVSLFTGAITVRAGAAGTVTVTATPENSKDVLPTPPAAAPPGMHLLNSGGAFSALEKDNHVTISTSMRAGIAELTLQVPASSSLNLSTMKGAITITGISGELSVQTVNGDIQLEQVGGSILAHALHGKIIATVTQLGPKPSAFSSLNGDIDLTLPAAAQANLRLQDDRGGIYLDDGFHFVPTANTPGPAGLKPMPPMPPMPPAPPNLNALNSQLDALKTQTDVLKASGIFNGPAVAGTLNGGGPELRIQDFRGNVYLHQAK
ncbi:MAG TPA: DUF4097 family beta strand repeat-containing protein [Terriglobales bacterium]|jgi:hypothetical protein